jgi:hypothetical protein
MRTQLYSGRYWNIYSGTSPKKNLNQCAGCEFSLCIPFSIYSIPPMLEIIELEEKIGHRLNRRRLDMTKTGSIYRPTKKRLIAARKRLAQRDKTRGSKEERALYRLELYREFQDLRDQVNKVFVAHEEEYR